MFQRYVHSITPPLWTLVTTRLACHPSILSSRLDHSTLDHTQQHLLQQQQILTLLPLIHAHSLNPTPLAPAHRPYDPPYPRLPAQPMAGRRIPQ